MNKELIIEHNKREKFVSDFLSEVARETNIINLKGENGSDRTPLRIQMIIVFSLIDVLASYWYEYLGKKEKSPRTRCCNWYNEFCKTERNKEFRKDKQWTKLSSNRMYKLRNSMVHFFGLSEKNEGLYITLAPNDYPNDELQKLGNKFKESGKNIVIIRPHNFHTLIKEGGIVMLKDWVDTINASRIDKIRKYEHIAGIKRVWDKINKEGAVKVPLGPKKVS